MNKTLIVTILIGLFAIGGFLLFQNTEKNKIETIVDTSKEEIIETKKFGTGIKAVVYKDPNCGCCVGYAEELEKQGFDVETVSTTNMANIKDKHNIPADKQSCHTIEINGYVIEGHVPMEAVEKLLKERPEIDGIGLPRMPAGTPGMPGLKSTPYEIYQIKDGEFSNYITI